MKEADKRPDAVISHEDDFIGEGEVPPYTDTIPGVIEMDSYPAPGKNLSEAALQHIEEKPWILEFAKKRKADIAAAITGRGREIIIAAGAGLLVAATAGVVIYKHIHHENKPEQEDNDIK